MKILLDHNLDWRLSRHLPDHEVMSALQMGWDLLTNGALLGEAESHGFSVLITADKGIRKQQRIKDRSIAVLVLRAPNNKLAAHLPMMEEVNTVLLSIQPGEIVEVFHPDAKPRPPKN